MYRAELEKSNVAYGFPTPILQLKERKYLSRLRLAIKVLCPVSQLVKAFRGVYPALDALREEAALAILGSHRQNVQVLHNSNNDCTFAANLLAEDNKMQPPCCRTLACMYVIGSQDGLQGPADGSTASRKICMLSALTQASIACLHVLNWIGMG